MPGSGRTAGLDLRAAESSTTIPCGMARSQVDCTFSTARRASNALFAARNDLQALPYSRNNRTLVLLQNWGMNMPDLFLRNTFDHVGNGQRVRQASIAPPPAVAISTMPHFAFLHQKTYLLTPWYRARRPPLNEGSTQ